MRRTVTQVELEGRWSPAAPELPVIGLDSGRPGPTVVVTANVHGDECVGLRVVQLLDARLSERPFRGAVHLFPTLNPEGLRARSRPVPEDGVDLNRVFPGNVQGGRATRLAAGLWRELSKRQPAALVDLHSDAMRSIPYIILDRPVRHAATARAELGERLEALALASGLTTLREYPDDLYRRFGLDRSLAGAAVNLLAIPAVTIEAGPRRGLDPRGVDAALQGVLGVLAALGLLDEGVPPHPTRVGGGPWRRAPSPRARRAGLVVPEIEAGAAFVRGDRLARVVDVLGEAIDEVYATEDGVVISWVEDCWVVAGGIVGTLAVPDPGGV